ncbi:MAG: hypothetical protein ACSHX0_12280 [Akkermansiaceae bacterium]
MKEVIIQIITSDDNDQKKLINEVSANFQRFEEKDVMGNISITRKCEALVQVADKAFKLQANVGGESCLNIVIYNEELDSQIFFYIGTVNLEREQTFVISINSTDDLFILLK